MVIQGPGPQTCTGGDGGVVPPNQPIYAQAYVAGPGADEVVADISLAFALRPEAG
jgi:hypothetical protein